MVESTILSTVGPVFCIAVLGYLWAGWRETDIGQITDLVIYVFAPALIFGALVRVQIDPKDVFRIAAAAAAVSLGCGGLLKLSSLTGLAIPRGLYLPVMFVNAANLPLPLSLLAFGETGLAYQVIYFVSVAILSGTLGVAIAKGDRGVAEIFKLPQIYAVTAALTLNYSGISLPPALAKLVDLLGLPAVPLMLFALGMRMRGLRLEALPLSSLAALARLGGGWVIGAAAALVLGLEGPSYRAVILGSTMPAAVINFAYAEKYTASPELVASVILLTTLASVALIPLTLAYLLN